MKSIFSVLAAAALLVAILAIAPVASAKLSIATSASSRVSAPPVPNGAWTRYHRDNAHTGYDSTRPTASGATTGWVSATLDSVVYTQPLVYNGLVYVGSVNNTVYALDQATGATVWSSNLGAAQNSGWQCGNVNPTGILGTPVIDTAASRIYVVAFLNANLAYYLFGLDLTTGMTEVQTQIKPSGFDWTIEQQRGALALSKDGTHVYVPFGGRAGDCGLYHGYVAGVPTNGNSLDELFTTPSTGEGIWASGGGVVDDSTGHVFFATGNAMPTCNGAIYSDSVYEADAALGALSYFQPLDWSAHWCGPDQDLGSASPVLISPSLLFVAGKYGQGFLLNPTALGGLNGQLFPSRSPYTGADVCHGNHSNATFGAFAYAAGRLYLECNGDGLVSLTVNTSLPAFSLCNSSCTSSGTWNAGTGLQFGPPIVAGGVVWVVDINGSGLYGYNASTGAPVYHSASFGVRHFTSPSEAGGQLFVSSNNVVRSFNMVAACSSMTASAAPSSPQPVGTPVVVTGSTSGPACTSPRYQFWLLPPGGVWRVVQPYSSSPNFNWSTTGLAGGTYRFSVWARNVGSTSPYDTFDAFDYVLTTSACTGMSASATPPASADVGTMVSVTGTATGCPNPRYEFWLRTPSGAWSVVRGYAAGDTFIWSTAGKTPGTYRFSIWARDLSSPGTNGAPPNTYDAFNAFDYTLTVTPCTGMGATSTPPGTASRGTQVSVNGAATGCPNPRYEFWLRTPSGAWTLAQGWTASDTYVWNTTAGMAAGTYRWSVWARDRSSTGTNGAPPYTYDAFSAFDYVLT